MGGLFMRPLPRIAAQSLLIVLVSKWPAGAKLYRALIACALFVSTSFLHPGSVAAETVFEDFQAYPMQSDTTDTSVAHHTLLASMIYPFEPQARRVH